MFLELNEKLDKFGQGVANSVKGVNTTTDISVDETVASRGQRNVLSKKTYEKKKSHATDEKGRFLLLSQLLLLVNPTIFCRNFCKKTFNADT